MIHCLERGRGWYNWVWDLLDQYHFHQWDPTYSDCLRINLNAHSTNMRLHCGNCVFDRWPILWTKLSTIRFSKSELSSLMPASSCVLNCERDDFAHLLRFSSFDAAIGFLYCPWYIYFVIFIWFHYFNFAFWINHAITVTIPYPYFNMHPDLDPWPNPSPRGARLVCTVNVCT